MDLLLARKTHKGQRHRHSCNLCEHSIRFEVFKSFFPSFSIVWVAQNQVHSHFPSLLSTSYLTRSGHMTSHLWVEKKALISYLFLFQLLLKLVVLWGPQLARQLLQSGYLFVSCCSSFAKWFSNELVWLCLRSIVDSYTTVDWISFRYEAFRRPSKGSTCC